MNAQLRPIPAPISRPVYDNTYLGWQADWITANRALLLEWWSAGEKDDRDFEQFQRSQHELELSRRDDFRQTLRQY